MNRRRFVAAAAGTLAVTVAGCAGRFGASDDGATETPEYMSARGTMEVVIDGEAVDLTADRFQAENVEEESLEFHFHEGDEYWYMEGRERLTVGEALDRVPQFGFETRAGQPVVTYDGRTYDAGDQGTAIAFAVDGESVDPTAYGLRDGDHVSVEITTE